MLCFSSTPLQSLVVASCTQSSRRDIESHGRAVAKAEKQAAIVLGILNPRNKKERRYKRQMKWKIVLYSRVAGGYKRKPYVFLRKEASRLRKHSSWSGDQTRGQHHSFREKRITMPFGLIKRLADGSARPINRQFEAQETLIRQIRSEREKLSSAQE